MRSVAELAPLLERHIHSFAGNVIDYVSFVDCDTLEPMSEINERTVLALAVRVAGKTGQVRLIDNGYLLPRAEG